MTNKIVYLALLVILLITGATLMLLLVHDRKINIETNLTQQIANLSDNPDIVNAADNNNACQQLSSLFYDMFACCGQVGWNRKCSGIQSAFSDAGCGGLSCGPVECPCWPQELLDSVTFTESSLCENPGSDNSERLSIIAYDDTRKSGKWSYIESSGKGICSSPYGSTLALTQDQATSCQISLEQKIENRTCDQD